MFKGTGISSSILIWGEGAYVYRASMNKCRWQGTMPSFFLVQRAASKTCFSWIALPKFLVQLGLSRVLKSIMTNFRAHAREGCAIRHWWGVGGSVARKLACKEFA